MTMQEFAFTYMVADPVTEEEVGWNKAILAAYAAICEGGSPQPIETKRMLWKSKPFN